MTELHRKALARLALSEQAVQSLYDGTYSDAAGRRLRDLCESHERLRAELKGAELLLAENERPCRSAVECATAIANYCLTRFPCDSPPHPMLDVPWFAEKIQQCIDEAIKTGVKR